MSSRLIGLYEMMSVQYSSRTENHELKYPSNTKLRPQAQVKQASLPTKMVVPLELQVYYNEFSVTRMNLRSWFLVRELYFRQRKRAHPNKHLGITLHFVWHDERVAKLNEHQMREMILTDNQGLSSTYNFFGKRKSDHFSTQWNW